MADEDDVTAAAGDEELRELLINRIEELTPKIDDLQAIVLKATRNASDGRARLRRYHDMLAILDGTKVARAGRSASTDRDGPWPCDAPGCGREFTTRQGLGRHRTTQHKAIAQSRTPGFVADAAGDSSDPAPPPPPRPNSAKRVGGKKATPPKKPRRYGPDEDDQDKPPEVRVPAPPAAQVGASEDGDHRCGCGEAFTTATMLRRHIRTLGHQGLDDDDGDDELDDEDDNE